MKQRDSFLRFLFLLYVLTMLWLLFCRVRDYEAGQSYWQTVMRNVNLKPLRTIRNYLYVLQHHSGTALFRTAVINLGGNVFLFIPAGYLLPRLWGKTRNFFRFLAVCTTAIVLVEIAQLLSLLGSCDIDDLILNLLGMVVGFLFFTFVNAFKK